MSRKLDTAKVIGTLIAVGLCVFGSFLLYTGQEKGRYSVAFGLLIFASFAILFTTWFRK